MQQSFSLSKNSVEKKNALSNFMTRGSFTYQKDKSLTLWDYSNANHFIEEMLF